MCGRFTLTTPPDALQASFGLAEPPRGFRPSYNLAPQQDIWAAVTGEDGARHARLFRWGLVPFWADDPAIGSRMINARAESLAEKPAYRHALKQRRCLVLADGFYEWQLGEDGRKHPMFLHLADGRPFAFAGLWERWSKQGVLESCTIVTTGASPWMAPIHDRMPVILTPEAQAAWLDPAAEVPELLPLLAPYAGEDLAAHEVSTLVNRPANDVPECVRPLAE